MESEKRWKTRNTLLASFFLRKYANVKYIKIIIKILILQITGSYYNQFNIIVLMLVLSHFVTVIIINIIPQIIIIMCGTYKSQSFLEDLWYSGFGILFITFLVSHRTTINQL